MNKQHKSTPQIQSTFYHANAIVESQNQLMPQRLGTDRHKLQDNVSFRQNKAEQLHQKIFVSQQINRRKMRTQQDNQICKPAPPSYNLPSDPNIAFIDQ
ncbi:hypothetical protein FGO68_gene4055 [Halteria grandinella]|uniref:Uncharacterized protein n=1 Tax=Halteria grandinella TaxID=5974 RepID=A0A8J8SZJ9_HALGN|nr:hypothetical protein FGO68_gene4055 [Halteria grandinella]